MQYDIHKDKKPDETVKKIKNTLKKIGIETTETYTPISYCEKTSVRVAIKGTETGTNGKGTCEINALASGYSEFMERLQSQFLLQFAYECDAKEYDIESLKNNYYVKNEIQNDIELKSILEDLSQITNDTAKKEINPVFKISVPFKSIKSHKTEYIPTALKSLIQNTNGFASGNTYEEAFVQALAEICERYEKRKIIKEQIKMPDVPLEYYSKYDNIVNLIKYIESNGYKVTIKDASCNELPVIITIFETPNKNFCLKAGSHPYLSVSIERTLTEFLQGFNFNETFLDVINSNYQDIDSIIFSSITKHINIDYSGYFKFLFESKSDYNFNPEIWEFNENVTNKDMAKGLTKRVLNIADDIYVRNYNFLDFPTISIYIPKISYLLKLDKKRILYENYQDNLIKNLTNKNFKKIKAEDIYYTCEFCSLFKENTASVLGHNLYLFMILSAILLNDEEKINKALNYSIKKYLLLEKYTNKKFLNTDKLIALKKYTELKFQNIQQNNIDEIITKEYGKNTLKVIKSLLNSLTLEKVINMIYKNFNEYLKQNDYKREEETKVLSDIKMQLKEIYLKNPPEQEHFMNFLYE